MAKYGEGDKQWIVEERADGTNVHNWHWAERDCLEWSRARLSSLLAGLTALDGEGGLTLRAVALDKLDGEAYVNIRKGKVIPGYELSLTLSWEAEAATALESGAVKVTGAAEVPYLADENADEDPELRVTVGRVRRTARPPDLRRRRDRTSDLRRRRRREAALWPFLARERPDPSRRIYIPINGPVISSFS